MVRLDGRVEDVALGLCAFNAHLGDVEHFALLGLGLGAHTLVLLDAIRRKVSAADGTRDEAFLSRGHGRGENRSALHRLPGRSRRFGRQFRLGHSGRFGRCFVDRFLFMQNLLISIEFKWLRMSSITLWAGGQPLLGGELNTSSDKVDFESSLSSVTIAAAAALVP